MKNKKIAVITLFWNSNSCDYLLRYLRAIEGNIKNLEDKNVEVMVYIGDNGPNKYLNSYIDSTQIEIPSYVKIIDAIKYVGYFACDNNSVAKLVYEEAKPDYFLFLNPDTETRDGCLEEMVRVMDTSDKSFAVDARQYPFEHPKDYDKETLQTSWCSGACMLVKSDLFWELGGFDEVFKIYAEDVDLSWRAWEAGYECLYAPDAICVHHCYGLTKNNLFRQFWNVRNGFLMRIKHGRLKDLVWFGMYILRAIKNTALTSPRESLNLITTVFLAICNSVYYIGRKKAKNKRPPFSSYWGVDYAKMRALYAD